MKHLCIIAAASALLSACAGGTDSATDPVLDSLRRENDRLKSLADERDSTVNTFLAAMNDIEENLATIKAKEKVLTTGAGDAELQKSKQEQIIEDIHTIQDLMFKNKERIASLSRQLRNSKINISELNKRIDRLVEQLQQKDAEISALQQELFRVNDQLENLFNEYNARIEDLATKDDELSTAWYAYGSFRELRDNGVLTKEGGFVGLGRMEKLVSDFNKSYFKKIDTRETPEIPLLAKTAKLITSHPPDSYRLEGQDAADKLVITNVEKFWSVSKYLVILVE